LIILCANSGVSYNNNIAIDNIIVVDNDNVLAPQHTPCVGSHRINHDVTYGFQTHCIPTTY